MNRMNADDRPQSSPPGQGRGGSRPDGGDRVESNAAPWGTIDLDHLRKVGRNLGGQLDEQVRKRPYAVLGAAAGFGFVAGSILGSRVGQVLLAAGVGYAAKRVLGDEFGVDRIQAGLEKLTGAMDRGSGRT